MRKLLAIAGTVAVSLIATAAAGADSIVYIKSGEVWIAHTDGSGARQFTLRPFHWGWPSEADNGTIVAAGGDAHGPYGFAGSDLYRFSANGNEIGGPIPTPGTYYTLNCPTTPPTSVRVSPDGSKIAYGSTLCSTGPTALWTPSSATGLSWPNQDNNLGVQDYTDPDWIDNTHFTVSHPGQTTGTQSMWAVTDTDSPPGGPGWIEQNATGTGFQGIVSRDGKVSALFEDDKANWIPPQTHNAAIWLYTAASVDDAEQNGYNLQCKLTLDAAQSSDPFDFSPTFSPDGTKLLWGDDRGVEIANVTDLSSSGGACTHVLPQLLIPGGAQPFYAAGDIQSQAANPSQPGDGPTPNPNPVPPTAKISIKTKHPRVHQPVVLDGGASKVSGKTTYVWSFGDHKTATGRRVTHKYSKRGTFTVTLTVRDPGGSRTVRVRVKVSR